MYFSFADGTLNLKSFRIPWLGLSIIFACITVAGTEITRWGLTLTEIVLPWEFPLLFIVSFFFTGLSLGIYILKNPNNFLQNIFIFILFSSSVGSLGWSVLDEFCLVFISIALLFLRKEGHFKEKNLSIIKRNRVWIFLFLALNFCLIANSLQGFFLWGEIKTIRFIFLFFSLLVISYILIFYEIDFGDKDEFIKKLMISASLYYFFILAVGTFSVIFEPKDTLTRAIFVFRGLGDISYVSAMFPAIVTVPLSFFLLNTKSKVSSFLIILNIVLPFLASMLMDTRAGLLIFVLCITFMPFAIGLYRTIKYISLGVIFSIITTTIIINEPGWFIEAFSSLLDVFNLEGGSYVLDYEGIQYAATRGDIGRYMLFYCSIIALLDQPFLFLTGVGNYGYWEVMQPYITAFRIEYQLPDYGAGSGVGGTQPRPPALGPWLIENGLIGFLLIFANILSAMIFIIFHRTLGDIRFENRKLLFLLIPILILPIWAYFAEFQENSFMYLILMPFGFMYHFKKSCME